MTPTSPNSDMPLCEHSSIAREDLAKILDSADIPVLMLVLLHLTGDRKWIEAPYSPQRDTYFFAEKSGGLSEAAQDEVKRVALDAILGFHRGELSPETEPSDELYLEMMRVCVAEPVPDEYLPMMLEEMRLKRRDPEWLKAPLEEALSGFHVLIIGAGMSGLCTGIKLKQAGIAFTIIEKNPEIGGTWYENIYPEVGCDVPNHYYSYSFRPNLDWTQYFSPGPEIEAYFKQCVTHYGLRDHIKFESEVISAHWNEASSEWDVAIRGTNKAVEKRSAKVLVSAVGQLNRPKVVDIKGVDDFKGPAFHTARWPKDIDLNGKRVVVIGTGASAMQLARSTAAKAESLTIFQRSAQWAIPTREYHQKVSEAKLWLLKHVPYYAGWYRFTLAWRHSDHLLATVRRDPDWEHPQRSVNARNDRHRVFLTNYIKDELGERTDLLDKVLPDYPPYGKRILVDNHWFRTLKRDNVNLITDDIDHISANGIVSKQGTEYPADIIIHATGFETSRLLGGMEIVGRQGISLDDVWGEDDSRAYLGINIPDFPNLFCLYGPNTNSGHGGSIIFIIECQVRYLTSCLMTMIEGGLSSVDCTKVAFEKYIDMVDEEHAQLIWSHPGMDTWYRNKAGRVVSIMPFRLVDYWQFTESPDWSAYRVESR
jgi:4-hydroxyacetophenone monooxygenase